MQDKYDIRNQHEKIHEKLYFLCKIFSIKISPLGDHRENLRNKKLRGTKAKMLMENILHKK
jgi:hypothetical protein